MQHVTRNYYVCLQMLGMSILKVMLIERIF